MASVKPLARSAVVRADRENYGTRTVVAELRGRHFSSTSSFLLPPAPTRCCPLAMSTEGDSLRSRSRDYIVLESRQQEYTDI